MKKLKRLIISEEVLAGIFIGNKEVKIISELPKSTKLHHIDHNIEHGKLTIFYTDESFMSMGEAEHIPIINII